MSLPVESHGANTTTTRSEQDQSIIGQVYLLLAAFLHRHGHVSMASQLLAECEAANCLPSTYNWYGETVASHFSQIVSLIRCANLELKFVD